MALVIQNTHPDFPPTALSSRKPTNSPRLWMFSTSFVDWKRHISGEVVDHRSQILRMVEEFKDMNNFAKFSSILEHRYDCIIMSVSLWVHLFYVSGISCADTLQSYRSFRCQSTGRNVDTHGLFVGSPDDRTAPCNTEDNFTLLLWNTQQDLLYSMVSSPNNNCHQEQYN